MGEHSGYAIASDGSPLFYRLTEPDDHGSSSGDATTLILCDGIGCDGFVWKYLRRDLAKNYRVVHWHYRGHGRTSVPRDRSRISIADFADDVTSVMREVECEKAVLFGHSMGVQVVLETYRRHPEIADALVLLCGSPENPLRTFRGTGTVQAALPAVRYAVNKAPKLFNRLARTLVPTRIAVDVAQRLEVNGRLINPVDLYPYLTGLAHMDSAFFISLIEEMGKHSAVDMLPSVTVPALIIAGDQDGFTPPEQSELMHREIPTAEIFRVEGGTHTAPLERPDAVNARVLRFLHERL